MEVSEISNVNLLLPRISEILSPIHPKLLQDHKTNDQTLREGCQVQMELTI
jgi:hypothetical protein